MSDADKPLEEIAAAEAKIDAPAPEPMPESADEPTSAADRLRAFEDEVLGPDTPRHDGKVERGVGSLYARMDDEQRATHARLERAVEAEQKLADAHAALSAAEAAVLAAESEVDASA